MCKQVKFQITNVIGQTNILGGIGIYNDDDSLVNVICGHCGEMLEPEDVKILEVFPWVNISDEILGD